MTGMRGEGWRTPAAVLLAAAIVAGTLLWTAAGARQDAARVVAAVDRVEAELRWARAERGR